MTVTDALRDAVVFGVVVWFVGCALIVLVSRRPMTPSRQYLSGRRYGLRIDMVVTCEHEVLVSLAGDPEADTPSGTFRVETGSQSLTRLERWRSEATPLRAYLSADGALMLVDPVLGGCVACEPALVVG